MLALGHVKKVPPYTRAIAYLDVLVIMVSGRVGEGLFFLGGVLGVEVVKVMDGRMIYTKK